MRKEVIGDATLYLADCREVLPTLTGVDAVITDPPYGVGIDYGAYADELAATTHMVTEFVQAARKIARVVAFTGGKSETWWALFREMPPRWFMVWYKGAQSTASPIGFNDFEPVFIYGDSVHNHAHDYFYCKPEPMGNYGHPCPKPLAYSATLIHRLHKPELGSVCDPFMGSGTTGVAALNHDRKFVGVEMDPKYFDIACRRIEEAYRTPRLFAPEAPPPTQLEIDTAA